MKLEISHLYSWFSVFEKLQIGISIRGEQLWGKIHNPVPIDWPQIYLQVYFDWVVIFNQEYNDKVKI